MLGFFFGALIPTKLLCSSILQALRGFTVVTDCAQLSGLTKSDFSCGFDNECLWCYKRIYCALLQHFPVYTVVIQVFQLLLAFQCLSISQSLSLPWFVDGSFCWNAAYFPFSYRNWRHGLPMVPHLELTWFCRMQHFVFRSLWSHTSSLKYGVWGLFPHASPHPANCLNISAMNGKMKYLNDWISKAYEMQDQILPIPLWRRNSWLIPTIDSAVFLRRDVERSLRTFSAWRDLDSFTDREIESSLCSNIKCSQIIIIILFFLMCNKMWYFFLNLFEWLFKNHTSVLYHRKE